MTLAPPEARDLSAWMADVLATTETEVTGLSLLSGGAIQENWLVEAKVDGVASKYVLRRDAAAAVAESRTRAQEFAILRAAHRSGVTVPAPIALRDRGDGGGWMLVEHVQGTALASRIVRDPRLGGDRGELARRLGRELARIHAIDVPADPDLHFLGEPPTDPALAEIERIELELDRLREARPALEWGLRWARAARPAASAVFTHRDFRTGNYLVDELGLTGVLDWEFAGWGDRHADLGWFCASCWRFGRADLEAGGVAARDELYAGYHDGGGDEIDAAAVEFWEVMAHIRWAVIALGQGRRAAAERDRALDLALTGHLVPELELAVVRATAPVAWVHHAQ